MQFTIPASTGNFSGVCSMAFFRPPITVTSELTGSLDAVEVWEIPSSGYSLDSDIISFTKDKERLLGALDLTKQAAMAVSQPFTCVTETKRMFEFRCAAGKACVIKYKLAEKLNINMGGFASSFYFGRLCSPIMLSPVQVSS